MIQPVKYTLYKNDEEHSITISPVNQIIPGSDLHTTGVFSLKDGDADMGDIVFDDQMNQWEYTCMGDLTHEEAAEIAKFIQNYKKSES